MSTAPSWIVLLPPLLVIATILTTRHMILSFLLGLITSALIVMGGNVYQAVRLSGEKLFVSTGLSNATSFKGFLSSSNLLIFIFLLSLGILIVLLFESGASQAYIRLVSKKVRSKKEAESASLILSLFFFIDDYFSALTVGSVMKPLAQAHNVHPVKLAFLTTAMATPLALISPISSWVGEIVLQLKQGGIGLSGPDTIIAADPYLLFISAIPALLYPLLLIIGTWYIVLRAISYGPMQAYDDMKTHTTMKLSAQEKNASFLDFIVPLSVLIFTALLTMLYTGGFSLFGGSNSLVTSLKHASVQQSLFTGGIIGLLISVVYFLVRGTLSYRQLIPCFIRGFYLMFPSIIMLICAWSLGSILKNELQTGAYIASLLSSVLSITLFPLMCFVSAALVCWMIGSAWATLTLMFPLVIDMLQKLLHLTPSTPLSSVELAIPLVGAILSGAVFGVHMSLISDNPIMSAASTGADHFEHVKTMSWYVVPLGISAALGFTCIGLTISSLGLGLSLVLGNGVSMVLGLALLEICQYLFHTKK